MNLDTYENFDQMLSGANSPDKQTREHAEAAIRNCKNDNITKFIVSLMKEISNANNQHEILQMATIVFRNSIIKSDRDENGNGIWTGHLDEQLRGHIKDALLNNLGCENKQVAKLAGQCIAAIASEELPRGQWGELIQNLVQNCTGNEQNYQVRLAAIQTLGYICDDIDQSCLSNSKELVELILHGTTSNIIPDQLEITQNASKALMRAMPVTGPYFEADEHRSIIMNGLIQAAQIDDEEVQENALQALIDVPKIGFLYLLSNLPDIGRLTMETMQKNNSKNLKYLLEFWENMCKEEIERNKYEQVHSNMEHCWKDVLNIALQSSCQIDFSANEQDLADGADEDNSVTSAAARLLNALAPLCKLMLWQEADTFLQEKLVNGQNWIDRYIGFQTLGSIAISCQEDPDRLIQYVQGTINLLTEKNNPPRIRLVAIWTLNSVSQFAPQLLMAQDHISIVVQILLASIKEDHPRIKTHSALTLKNMFVSAHEHNQTHIMDPYFQSVYQTIEEQILMPNAVLQHSFTGFIDSISTIFEVCDPKNKNQQILGYLLEKIKDILQNPQLLGQGTNKEQLEVFLNNYCGLFQICIVNVKITDQNYITGIIDLIIAMFNILNNKVNSGGLMMLTGLIASIEDKIEPHVNKLGEYIVKGTELNEQSDHQVCRFSVGFISDLSNNLQGQIKPYIQPFFDSIEDVLQNNFHELGSKLVAIIAAGDLFLASEEDYAPYIERTFKSISQAAKMSLDTNISNDPDEVQEMCQLREAIIDAYLSILHGMNMQDNTQQSIAIQTKESYAIEMFQFLEVLVMNGESYSLSEQMVKSIFELFTDLTLACFDKESNGRQNQPSNFGQLANVIRNSELPKMMPNAKQALGNDEHTRELIGRFDEVLNIIAQTN